MPRQRRGPVAEATRNLLRDWAVRLGFGALARQLDCNIVTLDRVISGEPVNPSVRARISRNLQSLT